MIEPIPFRKAKGTQYDFTSRSKSVCFGVAGARKRDVESQHLLPQAEVQGTTTYTASDKPHPLGPVLTAVFWASMGAFRSPPALLLEASYYWALPLLLLQNVLIWTSSHCSPFLCADYCAQTFLQTQGHTAAFLTYSASSAHFCYEINLTLISASHPAVFGGRWHVCLGSL